MEPGVIEVYITKVFVGVITSLSDPLGKPKRTD